MPRQNRRERFWITPWALARRAEGRMPESTAGMRESGVRMVREKAMDGFFNNLPGRSRISLTGLAINGHDQPIRFKGALKALE